MLQSLEKNVSLCLSKSIRIRKSPFFINFDEIITDRRTDRPTNQRTDGPTDKASYRDADASKKGVYLKFFFAILHITDVFCDPCHSLRSEDSRLGGSLVHTSLFHTSAAKLDGVQTIKCPPFAESITEGDIKWEIEVGDAVTADQVRLAYRVIFALAHLKGPTDFILFNLYS